MTERLFLDANVLFTATISPRGASAMLLKLAERQLCTVVASAFAVDEARRNIRAKYPDAAGTLEVILEQLVVAPEPNAELVRWASGLVPAKDAPILAGAVGAGAGILVTGDRRHFGRLFGTRVGGVHVLAPRAAVSHLVDG